MPFKILVVEDQLLIALHIEDAVIALGHEVAGIAANRADAMRLADCCDIALVDVQLQDGPTGPAIGRRLAETGKTVVFMTANPEALDDDIPGALGVISKPLFDLELIGSIQYAAAVHAGQDALAPERMRRFSRGAP
ncbi:response regulator [Rhizobium straminoryzae]|uniref:Response regulator n=1 Tax=Rhizobium straminoryzae TaxID=1387186 RepID=A0A549T2V6_9HYPH|nr:response regulator [Rhizobium straminoryzae]TRL36172.1 response regulator [Rhizobium straminoryzae]